MRGKFNKTITKVTSAILVAALLTGGMDMSVLATEPVNDSVTESRQTALVEPAHDENTDEPLDEEYADSAKDTDVLSDEEDNKSAKDTDASSDEEDNNEKTDTDEEQIETANDLKKDGIEYIDMDDEEVASDYAGGDGSKDNPYTISTHGQLETFLTSHQSGKYYKLTNNLNMENRGTVTIPNTSSTVYLDGNNNYISNLTITNDTGSYCTILSVLGNTSSASIVSDLTIKNLTIKYKEESKTSL